MNIWPAARKRLIGIPPLDYDGGLLACPSGARAVSPRSYCRSARTGRAPDRLDRPLFDRHRVRGHAARYLRPRQGRDNRPDRQCGRLPSGFGIEPAAQTTELRIIGKVATEIVQRPSSEMRCLRETEGDGAIFQRGQKISTRSHFESFVPLGYIPCLL